MSLAPFRRTAGRRCRYNNDDHDEGGYPLPADGNSDTAPGGGPGRGERPFAVLFHGKFRGSFQLAGEVFDDLCGRRAVAGDGPCSVFTPRGTAE